MIIEIVRQTAEGYLPGSKREVSKAVGATLIRMGLAKEFKPRAKRRVDSKTNNRANDGAGKSVRSKKELTSIDSE